MSYFLLPSNPVRPKCPLMRACVVNIAVCLPSRNYQVAVPAKVDLGGIEPPSNSLFWDTLRFLCEHRSGQTPVPCIGYLKAF